MVHSPPIYKILIVRHPRFELRLSGFGGRYNQLSRCEGLQLLLFLRSEGRFTTQSQGTMLLILKLTQAIQVVENASFDLNIFPNQPWTEVITPKRGNKAVLRVRRVCTKRHALDGTQRTVSLRAACLWLQESDQQCLKPGSCGGKGLRV